MTITITAAAAAQKILLTVASSPAITEPLTIWRVHEDGSRHEVLTIGQAVLIGGWTGFDNHAPGGKRVTYIAEAGGQTSAPSGIARMLLQGDWIMHSSDPTLSMRVTLVGPPADISQPETSQRFEVLKKKLPVYRKSRPRSGKSGSLSLLAQTESEIASIEKLFEDGSQVLLNTSWVSDVGWMWVQPKALDRQFKGRADQNVRVFTFAYEECEQPDVDIVSSWTFDKVAARYASFAEVTADYTDFARMKLDVRG